MVTIITLLPEEMLVTVLAAIKPMLARPWGVVFLSDVEVIRRDYFEAG